MYVGVRLRRFPALYLVIVSVGHGISGAYHVGIYYPAEEYSVGACVHALRKLAVHIAYRVVKDNGGLGLTELVIDPLELLAVPSGLEPEAADKLHGGLF